MCTGSPGVHREDLTANGFRPGDVLRKYEYFYSPTASGSEPIACLRLGVSATDSHLCVNGRCHGCTGVVSDPDMDETGYLQYTETGSIIQYWTADPNSPVAGVEAWRTDTPATDPRTRNFVAASAIWGGTGGLCREPYVAPSGSGPLRGAVRPVAQLPEPYPATSSCSIRATFGDGITSALAFEYFETSPGDDYIEIDGVQYSGLKNGAAVTAVAQAPPSIVVGA